MHEQDMSEPGPRTAEGGPETGVAALLARERARGLSSLGGSHAEIAIPVRQALVNRLIGRVMASRPTTDVQVDLLQGARLGVTVAHRVLGFPVRAQTVLELEREVDLASGRLVMRHDEGTLWKTIRSVAGSLGLLPAGVSFGEGTVEIDLRAIAARARCSDLLLLARRIVIHGPADGLFAVEADFAVPDVPQPASPAQAPHAPQDSVPAGDPHGGQGFSPAGDPQQWLSDLHGSRARVDLHVRESLANELLDLTRALAAAPRQASAAGVPLQWTSLVRDAKLRFTDQRLLLSLDLELPEH